MKGNYENYILYGILALVIIGLIFSFSGFFSGSSGNNIGVNPNVPATTAVGTGFKPINTGSTNDGDVSIELTPQKVANGQLKVNIAANTHSVDISQFDLRKITTLEYGGKKINPVSASTLSGHHTNGELAFNVEGEIKEFVIKIKGIPKVEERVFSWP